MGLFSRKKRDKQLFTKDDPFSGDLSETFEKAQELLAKTHSASDGNHHWSAISDETHGRLTDELARAEAAFESKQFTGGQPFSGAGADSAEWASAFAGSNGAGVGPAQDSISKLERLVKLRDEGALTSEEFEQQKRQVLDAG
jgi:putative oligomerization/nucleic acid binding protein